MKKTLLSYVLLVALLLVASQAFAVIGSSPSSAKKQTKETTASTTAWLNSITKATAALEPVEHAQEARVATSQPATKISKSTEQAVDHLLHVQRDRSGFLSGVRDWLSGRQILKRKSNFVGKKKALLDGLAKVGLILMLIAILVFLISIAMFVMVAGSVIPDPFVILAAGLLVISGLGFFTGFIMLIVELA